MLTYRSRQVLVEVRTLVYWENKSSPCVDRRAAGGHPPRASGLEGAIELELAVDAIKTPRHAGGDTVGR
jgi:hypothetical protein